MDTNLRNIRNKLVSGEKLSTTDLRSLEPLHDAIYDNDGRVVGISGSTAEEEDDPLAGEFNLDYVDRSFLDGRHHRQRGQPSKRLPRLVRYVGKLFSESKSNTQLFIYIPSTLRLLRFFLAFPSNLSLWCLILVSYLNRFKSNRKKRHGPRHTRSRIL
jgi:hypothetical protein